MFTNLSERLQGALGRFSAPGRLKEEDVARALRDVRLALLEADVALPVVKEFIARVRERAAGVEIHRALNAGQQALQIVHEELIATLGETGAAGFLARAATACPPARRVKWRRQDDDGRQIGDPIAARRQDTLPRCGGHAPPCRHRAAADAWAAD